MRAEYLKQLDLAHQGRLFRSASSSMVSKPLKGVRFQPTQSVVQRESLQILGEDSESAFGVLCTDK
jgi:hypothetical protein